MQVTVCFITQWRCYCNVQCWQTHHLRLPHGYLVLHYLWLGWMWPHSCGVHLYYPEHDRSLHQEPLPYPFLLSCRLNLGQNHPQPPLLKTGYITNTPTIIQLQSGTSSIPPLIPLPHNWLVQEITPITCGYTSFVPTHTGDFNVYIYCSVSISLHFHISQL